MSTPQTATSAFAQATPDKVAVVMGDITLTYAQLDAGSLAIAGHFHAQGLGVGGVVAVLMDNHPDMFLVAWAIQRSGLYLVPIGTKLTASEISYILQDCGAQILVSAPQFSLIVQEAIAMCPAGARPTLLLEAGGASQNGNDLKIAVQSSSAATFEATEGGDMLYTSGTTGRPKGVKRPLSGKAFGGDTSRADRSRDLFLMDAQTVFLSPAPLYHAAPLRFSMSVHRLGGTVVLMKGFDAHTAWALLHDHKVTHSQWAPTMFNRLLAAKTSLSPSQLPRQHKVAIHAGAPCAVPIKRAMIEWWGPILHEYYSGTESIGFTHIDSHDWLTRPGSVGQAIGCKLHIVDGVSGAALPAHQTGGVYFEGKAPLIYHNSAQKTAQATHEKGWATMGDVGYLDAEGFLFLTDRAAFTIISGGVNIYPKEVEDGLLAQADIEDAAVFGTPDADLGEAVIAALVLKTGAMCDGKTALQICSALRATLSGVKIPRRIVYYDELPRSDAGKLLKRKLQEDFVNLPADQSYSTRQVAPA